MMTETNLAYVAGFFDGEGSITIHHNWRPSPRGKAPNHTLQVSIGNTDPVSITWIHAEFGGSLVLRRKSDNPNQRRCLQWIIRCRLASNFLAKIFPYLRQKKKQALLAIEYQSKKKMLGPKTLTEAEIDNREWYRNEIRALNSTHHLIQPE